MGLRDSTMFHLECTLTDRGGQGDPREASLKEKRQKVREQRALHGAAIEAAVWPCQVTDNNSINNDNSGG